MSVRTALLVCVALLFASVTAPGTATAGNVAREARDRVAIEKLMWDYARALDTGNAQGYAALYTQNGAFGKVAGRSALEKMITDLNQSRAERKAKGEVVYGTLHMTTDHFIEFTDADHATISYYWLTSFVAPKVADGAPKPPDRIPFTGHGVDTIVRSDGKWLIQNRNVSAPD